MLLLFFFFFKQKTAYEMRISDWSSDVCSSDLGASAGLAGHQHPAAQGAGGFQRRGGGDRDRRPGAEDLRRDQRERRARRLQFGRRDRSEEHTSELQSLMRISYAVLCL